MVGDDDTTPGSPLAGNPLILALQDLAQAGKVRLLGGYVGQATRSGYTRLYADLELSDFVEIPTAAIVYSLDLRTSENPLAGAALWVTASAETIRSRESPSRLDVQGSFLGGEIASARLGPMSVPQFPGGQNDWMTRFYCVPTGPGNAWWTWWYCHSGGEAGQGWWTWWYCVERR